MPLDPRFIDEAQALIIQRVKQEVPEASVDSGGSAVNVIFARGGSAVLAPLLQQQDDAIRRRTLSNLDALTDDDFSLLFENLLIDEVGGVKSRGFVNVYYSDRATKTFPAGTRITNEDGSLGYVVEADLEFGPSDHFVDQETGDFYVRLPMVAESEGEEYDLDIGEINLFSSDSSGSLRVSNASKFIGGISADSKEESLAYAKRGISTRTTLTPDGANFVVKQSLGTSLLDILVTGMNDDEMTRDVLHDMGAGASPRFKIGRSAIGGTKLTNDDGSPIHVGGRVDIYTWFRNLNIAQQVIDLFADMQFASTTSSGATSVIGRFVAGTTGTVSSSGKLVLEAGSDREETVRYTSVAAVGDVYTFTLDVLTPTTFLHEANSAIRVANNGVIDIADDGVITLRPIIQVKEIRLLDPTNFQVIGDPVPASDPDSRFPGWYITDRHESDSYSAREYAKLVLDEKRGAAGNDPISASDGSVAHVSSMVELTSASSDFTGYQGRSITVVVGGSDVEAVIIAVKNSGTTAVLDAATTDVPVAAGYSFSIDDGAGDYIQYPIRVTFNTNTEIQQLQNIFDQDSNRTITDDILSRTFLPVFIDFVMRYKGDGTVEQVRASVLSVIQTSAGSIVGQESTAEFDHSDLVAAAYEDGLANKVETPFQVRARYQNEDGTETVKYINPDENTVNELAVRTATVSGDQFVLTTRPESVDEFLIPSRGYLRLGGFDLEPNQVVEYIRVIEDGDDQIFVLKEGETVLSIRPVNEVVVVHALDYDPDNVIEDGTITATRFQRPYFGEVLFQKVG